MAARKHMDRVINLVEIMRSSEYTEKDGCIFLCIVTNTSSIVSQNRRPVGVLQERLRHNDSRSALSLPHEPDRTGAGAKGRAAGARLAELAVNEAVRQLPVSDQWHIVRKVYHENLKSANRYRSRDRARNESHHTHTLITNRVKAITP